MNLPKPALLVAACLSAHAATAQDAETALPQDPAPERVLKIRVAVPPLEWPERYTWIGTWYMPPGYRMALHERLVKKLHDTGHFIVLERTAMQALLREQRVNEQNTGQSLRGSVVPAQGLVRVLITDFTMKSSGHNVGVRLPGIGTVGGSTTEAAVGVNVMVFDVVSSEILATEDARGFVRSNTFTYRGALSTVFTSFQAFERSPLGDAANKAIDQAVDKIVLALSGRPWSAGVADWDPQRGELIVNAGADSGIRVGDLFEIHQVSRVVVDPATGQVLGHRTAKTGLARITEVEEKFSVAILIEGDAFQIGDIVKEAPLRQPDGEGHSENHN